MNQALLRISLFYNAEALHGRVIVHLLPRPLPKRFSISQMRIFVRLDELPSLSIVMTTESH
jgi:hypothetical protein